MSEQLSFYKMLSQKQYAIEIPVIQRDYAQGRPSAVGVRTDFLNALYDYLREGTPQRDIDFIYGDVDSTGNFVPLDGQQRLTTLFLLHAYLALKEGKMDHFKQVCVRNGFSRFTYKTRQSASDFCDALFRNNIDLNVLLSAGNEKKNALSGTIKDSAWYFLSWNYDPTIQSMLCMLDAIHYRFTDSAGFYDRLVDLEAPVITFQFLKLTDYGLTDDLYIKMNSRGKPLTRFENFKAKFEQHLEQFNGRFSYPQTVREYFAHRIDTIWADLFWPFRDTREQVFDKQYMNFISTLAINRYALANDDPRQYIDKQSNLPLDFYMQMDEPAIQVLIDSLDILSTDPKYRRYLPECHYYDELRAFTEIINDRSKDAGYPERIKFFAYCEYLAKWKDADGLADWMRVTVNLTENTIPYNSETEYINSLRALHRLLPQSKKILDFLSSKSQLTGFNPSQVKEEQMKAHLILRSAAWSNKIHEAERHPYFKGQITFALAFSGIESYYDEHINCGWNEEADKLYFEAFGRFSRLIFSLFDEDGLNPQAKDGHRLHRATLSKGNYLLYAKSNLSFLIDRERDVSWKRLLLGDGERSEKRDFLREVITDPAFSSSDLSTLETICSNSNGELLPWRKKLLEHPELFEYLGSYKYIRYTDDNTVFLLSSVRMSAEHSELFTHALYLKLRAVPPAPFVEVNYVFVSTDKDDPYLYLTGFKYKQYRLVLDIYYVQGLYDISFYDQDEKAPDAELSGILTINGFTPNSYWFELSLPEDQIMRKLTDLCHAFLSFLS
ncbi:MAG TPA: DUF262 domain-containing protein [Puia sp.]|nr:DUF262 domain-containing protein [Puia sp.]